MGLNNQFAYDTRGDVNLESSDSESFITAEPKRKRLVSYINVVIINHTLITSKIV